MEWEDIEKKGELDDNFGLVEHKDEVMAIIYYNEGVALVQVLENGKNKDVHEITKTFKTKPTIEEFKEFVNKAITSVVI